MSHIYCELEYDYRTDSNDECKYQIYEVILALMAQYMGPAACMVDLPGPHLRSRRHQVESLGFKYFAAERDMKLRRSMPPEEGTFDGGSFYSLARRVQRDHKKVPLVLSHDGTQSPVTMLHSRDREQLDMLVKIASKKRPIIVNVCVSRRLGRNPSKRLNAAGLEHLTGRPSADIVRRLKIDLKNMLYELGWRVPSLHLGDSTEEHIFHYGAAGGPFRGAAMSNIILLGLP